jgi:hypothetical protein
LFEQIVKALSERARRVVKEVQERYTMIYLKLNEADFVICASRGAYAYIVKIGLEHEAPSLNCREFEYSPSGLYAFGASEEELVSKIIEKLEVLHRRSTRIT